MHSPPIALSVRDAAARVGISRSQLYRAFLNTGLVRTVATGKRDRVIIVAELDQAFAQFVAKQRAEAP